MSKYVIDAFSWLDYFEGNASGEKVKDKIENKNNEIITNIVTISEVISVFKRKGFDYNKAYELITNLSKIYLINLEFSREVGILHADIRKKIKDFGLADTFVLLTARRLKAKILTGDPHFKGFKEAIMI